MTRHGLIDGIVQKRIVRWTQSDPFLIGLVDKVRNHPKLT